MGHMQHMADLCSRSMKFMQSAALMPNQTPCVSSDQQRRRSSHYRSLNSDNISCKARFFSTLRFSNRSKDGGPWDERVEAHMMASLRRRIEDFQRRELMKQVGEESPLHTLRSSSLMKWEKDYEVFYQEEVCLMMAHMQEWLLQCRPSHSLVILLCLWMVGAIGIFNVVSTLFLHLLLPTLIYLLRIVIS